MNDDDWDGEPHCPQNARYTFHLVAVRGYYSEQAAMSGTGQRRSGSPHTCSQSERLDNGVEQDHEDLRTPVEHEDDVGGDKPLGCGAAQAHARGGAGRAQQLVQQLEQQRRRRAADEEYGDEELRGVVRVQRPRLRVETEGWCTARYPALTGLARLLGGGV